MVKQLFHASLRHIEIVSGLIWHICWTRQLSSYLLNWYLHNTEFCEKWNQYSYVAHWTNNDKYFIKSKTLFNLLLHYISVNFSISFSSHKPVTKKHWFTVSSHLDGCVNTSCSNKLPVNTECPSTTVSFVWCHICCLIESRLRCCCLHISLKFQIYKFQQVLVMRTTS